MMWSANSRQPTALDNCAQGQGLIAFAVLILVFLVIGGVSISMLKTTSANKTVVDQRSLQSYYVAMAGVQEALSTRMYPAGNQLVWWRPNPTNPVSASNPGNRVTPLYGLPNNLTPALAYPDEGIVCQSGTRPCPSANIIGAYRYFVLNGDQGVNAQTSNGTTVTYWADTAMNLQGHPIKIAPQAFYANENDPNLSASEFIVVSKGYTCVAENVNGVLSSIAIPGALVDMRNPTTDNQLPPTVNRTPYCQSPYNGTPMHLDTTTLVTRVVIDPDNGDPDHVVGSQILKDDTNIRLGGGRKAFIPGTGWTNGPFSFEAIYAYAGGATANPATPAHIVFYDFIRNDITCSADITGTSTDLRSLAACAGIGPRTVMQLYFRGPIDHRSIDPYNDYSFQYCLDDTSSEAANDRCNIQINRGATPEGGYQMIFEPPKNNQIKLLPNLQELPSSSTDYEIVINTQNIRSWSGARGPNGPYRIRFRVN